MIRLPAPIPVLAALLALYLLAPIAAGLVRLGGADWSGADLGGLSRACLVSVASASAATTLIGLGGIPLGWVLARIPGRAVAALGLLTQLPLALPPLTSGVLLLFLLGDSSPIGRLTNGALTDSFAGIVLAETFVAAPFLIVAARSAFAAVDPQLEDVAASLGHPPGAIFLRVSLPLGWRTIAAGLLLAWLRAFGEFGATVMVAYHPTSLPVFTYVAFGSEGLPAMLPIMLPTLVAAVAVMAVSRFALRAAGRRPAYADPPPLPPPDDAAAAAPGQRVELHLRRHLDGFALSVDWQTDARRLAILGPSGSGKSLTLRLIAGLDRTDDSRVRFAGGDLGSLPPQARRVAYVPQSYGLLPNLTVAEQIRFAVDADPALASHWTGRLGLVSLQHRRPDELSLGQQQRVALARALSRRSAGLVLLDEPFSALDMPLRARLRRDLLALQNEMMATTVLVTHDPVEAMLLADELLLLHSGQVLQAGPVSAVFARPANETAARLLGAETIGCGHVAASDRIDIGGVLLEVSGPPLVGGTSVGWAVRPHQIRIGGEGQGSYPARILARTAVADGQRRVALRLGDATLDILADPGCPPEGPCRAHIDPGAIQVWPRRPAGKES